MNKRQFIKDVLLTTMATPLGLAGIAQSFKQKENVPAIVLAKDDAFWLSISCLLYTSPSPRDS